MLAVLVLYSNNSLAEDGWFIELGLGSARQDTGIKVQQGAVDLLFSPEDHADQYAISSGYRFNDKWSVSLEYGHLNADEVDQDNLLISLNRHWSIAHGWEFTAGLIGLYSELEWKDDPINTISRERQSEEHGWGGQIGLLREFGERWQWHLRYQYLDLDHKTFLQPPSGVATFHHKNPEILTLGIRLSF